MQNILFIGIGGFLGSSFRYLVGDYVHRFFDSSRFPYGTLAVNLIGCFLIGFLGGATEGKELFSPQVRMLIFIGVLGGFTTFSTFGYETFSLIRNNQIITAVVNVTLHVVLSIMMVWGGYQLSQLMHRLIKV